MSHAYLRGRIFEVTWLNIIDIIFVANIWFSFDTHMNDWTTLNNYMGWNRLDKLLNNNVNDHLDEYICI